MQKRTFLRNATGLVREYSWTDVFFLGSSGLGVGMALTEIFAWTFYQYPQSNLSLMMILGFIMSIFIGLCFVLFAVAMPRSGGDYIFTSRTLGPRWGFLANFSLYMQQIATVPVNSLVFTTVLIPGALLALGASTNNPGILSIAPLIAKPEYGWPIALGILTFYFITTTVSGKLWKTVTYVILILNYFSITMLIGILIFSSHSGFVAAFNSISKLPYDQVIPTAKSLGWTIPELTIAGTLAGLPYAVSFFGGFERGTYIAGETKKVSFALPLGVFLCLTLGLIYFLVAIPMITSISGSADWYKALLWLWYQHKDKYPLSIQPGPNLIASLAASPIVIILFSLTFASWGLGANLARFQCFSRCMFAWSFDRILPTWVSKTSDRFHTPVRAIFVFYLFTIFTSYLAYYTNVLAFFLSTLGIGYLLRTIMYVAAAVVPYRKNSKAIYELSPLKPRIGKLPLISIAGVIAAIFLLYLSYLSYSSLFAKSMSDILPAAIGASILFIVGGVGIYQAAKMYWARKGIDINIAFEQLPPE